MSKVVGNIVWAIGLVMALVVFPAFHTFDDAGRNSLLLLSIVLMMLGNKVENSCWFDDNPQSDDLPTDENTGDKSASGIHNKGE